VSSAREAIQECEAIVVWFFKPKRVVTVL